MGIESKEIRPQTIQTLEDLLPFAGQVIKFSKDQGNTWTFARLFRTPEHFDNGSFGLAAYNEVDAQGVHSRGSITDKDFERGCIVEKAEPDEYKEIKFSFS
jgi:hypothetical protein